MARWILLFSLACVAVATSVWAANCGINEVYMRVSICPPLPTCNNTYETHRCPAISPMPTKEKCICKVGYLRNSKGVCVPKAQCESRCGINEVYRTVDICPPLPTCNNTYENHNCPAIIPMPTEEKCICKSGYLRNSKGACVPKAQCETNCGINEVYMRVSICPPLPTCNNTYETHRCPAISPMPTKEKCICKVGYLRNSAGVCVPKAQCDNKCGLNEVYRTVDICPPLPTCNNTYENHNCPAIIPMPTEEKCICKAGYLRNSIGVCVPEDQCESD